MMRWLIFSLLLAGCAQGPGAVEVRTVEVIKEVMVPCPAVAPARPAKLGPLPADAAGALLVVSAKLLEYAGAGGYADRAEDALSTCSKAAK